MTEKTASPSKTEKEHLVRSLKGDNQEQELHSEENVAAQRDDGKSSAAISDNKGAVEQECDSAWRDYAGYERKSEANSTADKIMKQETPG